MFLIPVGIGLAVYGVVRWIDGRHRPALIGGAGASALAALGMLIF